MDCNAVQQSMSELSFYITWIFSQSSPGYYSYTIYIFACTVCGVTWSPEHIVESHISSAVQSLHLIAHVFKQQLVFVQVHLQPASEQTQQEFHSGCRDHTLEKQ